MVKVCGRIISAGHILTAATLFQIVFLAIFLPHGDITSSWSSSSVTLLGMRAWSPKGQLPSISRDGSELVLSSVLERSSSNENLHVTSFLLSKSLLDPRGRGKLSSVKGVAVDAVEKIGHLIRGQAKLSYSSSGIRQKAHYHCKIKLDRDSSTALMTIPAHFLPNRLTSDYNSNRNLDVMRCPLHSLFNATRGGGGGHLQRDMVAAGRSLEVELYRGDTLLTAFLLPWRTRSTGYLFSGPPAASQLRAWNGLLDEPWRQSEGEAAKGDSGGGSFASTLDRVHLCVATSPGRSLRHLVEFVEHHKRIGVGHIYFSVALSWKSIRMRDMLYVLRDYISEGVLTVQSSTDKHQDPSLSASGVEGILWHRHTARLMHINSCLFIAKGNAEYLGVWDLADFFVPSKPGASLPQVVHARAEECAGRNGAGAGCFMTVEVKNVFPNVAVRGDKPWLSSQYDARELLFSMSRDASLRYILPTERIFQGGLRAPGACHLPRQSHHLPPGCSSVQPGRPSHHNHSLQDGFCMSNMTDYQYNERRIQRSAVGSAADGDGLAFDDVVHPADGCALPPRDGGVVYSFRGDVESARNDPDAGSHAGAGTGTGADAVATSGWVHRPRDRLQTSENHYGQWFSPAVESDLDSKKYSGESLVLPLLEALPQEFDDSTIKWNSLLPKYLASLDPPPPVAEQSTSSLGLDNTSSLPSFTTDHSDVCLGSLIERQHDSGQLHISTFFIQHELLYLPAKGYGFIKIRDDAETKGKWKRAILAFNDTHYSHTGQRFSSPRFFCRISVELDSVVANLSTAVRSRLQEPVSVRGDFLPNSLTVDQNANRRVDILRCAMQNSELLQSIGLPSSDEVLKVEIYRETTFLIAIEIPWRSRRVGFSLDSPGSASKFNAWQQQSPPRPTPAASDRAGLRQGESQADTGEGRGDAPAPVLHMCVPGFETPISQRSLTVYAEFLQHHFLQGVQHMFVAGPYAWGGANMALFLTAFRSFVDEGLLSVASLAEGGQDEYLYSILGALIDRDNAKVFQVSMCLYLSKGVADYVAVWDNDEFFVPKPPHHSILDIIRSSESSSPSGGGKPLPRAAQQGFPGWADGDDHPFCFLHLSSQVVYAPVASDFDYFSPRRGGVGSARPRPSDFLGDQFRHLPETKRVGLAFQKSILPTRLIFQAGLHVGAACHLPARWTHCNRSDDSAHDRFCYSTNSLQYHGYTFDGRVLLKTSPRHNFDSLVENKDARLVPREQASLLHVQVHRLFLAASPEALAGGRRINDYAKHFFPQVLEELKRRHLLELLTSNNFQKLYETGSPWGKFLAAPDESSSAQYVASHKLLQTLWHTRGAGSEAAGDTGWLDFAVFYDAVVRCKNDAEGAC